MRAVLAAFCARAASGNAAAPPSRVMKSRLFIDPTEFDPPAKASSQHIELAATSQPGSLLGSAVHQ